MHPSTYHYVLDTGCCRLKILYCRAMPSAQGTCLFRLYAFPPVLARSRLYKPSGDVDLLGLQVSVRVMQHTL